MKKGEKRKLELLNIAYRIFISKGYENTSVDEIIDEAGIAKGTYYYYFESKEQMLEEVIGMMIDKEAEAAKEIAKSDLTVEQKIVGIIGALRPTQAEQPIENALMEPENALMHRKIRLKIVEKIVPVLSEVVEEGIEQGIFDCRYVPERVRMLLIISTEIFDVGTFSERDIDVFIDTIEKLLGAESRKMDFIRTLIRMEPEQSK